MNTLVNRSKAPSADLIQPCVATDRHLGLRGLPRPPRVVSRCHSLEQPNTSRQLHNYLNSSSNVDEGWWRPIRGVIDEL
jgi:hypothetical protein